MGVGLVAFVVYASYGNVLTVSVVFTTFATINLLRLPIKIVPMAAMRAGDSLVAMKRLGRILELDETPERQTYDLQDSTLGSIHMKNVSFSWNKRMSTDTDTNTKTAADPVDPVGAAFRDEPSTCDLINLSLTIKPGELVCVVGRVASGKTSLISALLGEMEQAKGEIEVKANQIACVAQTAWIQSTTLKDNILFGAEMNEIRYNKAIEASQLKSDIQMMIGGDMCEIGDRGITLSGGQMQRLAIARALYLKGTEMFLLDDVLSAVDVHVADALFQQCIVKEMGGRTRILTLNSHFHLLSASDKIVVMSQGKIACSGTYQEVQDHPSFLDLTKHQTQIDTVAENVADIESDVRTDVGADVGADVRTDVENVVDVEGMES